VCGWRPSGGLQRRRSCADHGHGGPGLACRRGDVALVQDARNLWRYSNSLVRKPPLPPRLASGKWTRIVSLSRNSRHRSMRAPHCRLNTPTFRPLTATSLAQSHGGENARPGFPRSRTPGLVSFVAISRSRPWPKAFSLVLLSLLSQLLPLWRRRTGLLLLRPLRIIATRRNRQRLRRLPRLQLPLRRLRLRVRFQASGA
jgi:hypothetical protein